MEKTRRWARELRRCVSLREYRSHLAFNARLARVSPDPDGRTHHRRQARAMREVIQAEEARRKV